METPESKTASRALDFLFFFFVSILRAYGTMGVSHNCWPYSTLISGGTVCLGGVCIVASGACF